MYYSLNNLSLDSAVNFQITSGEPTSANAIDYAYIGRTNVYLEKEITIA